MVYELFFRKLFSKNARLTPPLLLYFSHNTIKYFSECNQTPKKIIFLEIIFIRKYFTIENILQRNKQSLSESVRDNKDGPILVCLKCKENK